jgi:hypothetical protein
MYNKILKKIKLLQGVVFAGQVKYKTKNIYFV